MRLKGLNKVGSIVVFLLLSSTVFSIGDTDSTSTSLIEGWEQSIIDKYQCLEDSSLSFQAYEEALRGYALLQSNNSISSNENLTIIDFSQPSSEKRLYILNVITNKIIKRTYCAHGKNSGIEMARKFSNSHGSNMSSLGFYLTEDTYTGKFDIALRLKGLEASNNKARSRGVVIHGAKYATEEFLLKNGRLGRSFGCPAIPLNEAPEIINTLKNGSLVYIYHTSTRYRQQSKILRNYSFLGA